jgi:hypothetical protein
MTWNFDSVDDIGDEAKSEFCTEVLSHDQSG